MARWEEKRDFLRELGGCSTSAATLIDNMLSEVRSLLDSRQEEALTLTEASALSGYSQDHLGRLIRSGKLRNAGRPGAPRVRRGDLPLRPGRQSGTIAVVRDLPQNGENREQIARAVTNRYRGGR